MLEWGLTRPIWVHFDSFTGLETLGETKTISQTIPGVSPEQRDYVIQSVVIKLLDDDEGGLGDAQVRVQFYGNDSYGDITLADDRFQGWLQLECGIDGYMFTDGTGVDFWAIADHNVNLMYRDFETSTTVRKVYAKLWVSDAGGPGVGEILDTLDTWQMSVCLIPL